jgi:hypothetical protein
VPFSEWDVEDRYAALDRENADLLAALEETLTVEWNEDSSAAAATVPPDADLSDRDEHENNRKADIEWQAVDDDEHTEVRIDRMIQAVSAAVANEIARQFPVEQRDPEREVPQRQLRSDVRRSRWRAAPAAGTLDLVNPAPTNSHHGGSPRVAEAAPSAQELPPAADASDTAAPSPDDSEPKKSNVEARPYARLFSQARRLRIHA